MRHHDGLMSLKPSVAKVVVVVVLIISCLNSISQVEESTGQILCDGVRHDEWKCFAHQALALSTLVEVNTLKLHFDEKPSPVMHSLLGSQNTRLSL